MLPLSVEDAKKTDDDPIELNSSSRQKLYEVILLGNVLLIYITSMLTHVSFHYRIPLVLLVTMINLGIFLKPLSTRRIPRWLQTIIFPLTITFAILIAYIVVARNVPSIAFAHAFLDDVSLPPKVPMDGSVSISVVIPARNEDTPLLVNTFKYLFSETPDVLLKEIIVVDDESEEPLDAIINTGVPDPLQRQKIKLVRLDERQGLTNAKIIGAEKAVGTHVLFLDGHCRVAPHYAERMLARSLSESPRDIIVPEVIDVDGETFNFKSMNGGVKMMFEWNFEFSWFDNNKNDDNVPVSSGGILLMTRREFLNGRYDRGMLEWGGENIEQSLRAWMCGAKVIVERQAKIGHVFSRKLRPGRVKVSTVERNHARAAFVWLDDWLKYFEFKHRRGNMMLTDMGPHIDERLELRHRLQCGKFDVFVEKFSNVFDQRNLFMDREASLQDMRSGLCITGKQLTDTGKVRDRKVELVWMYCSMYDTQQRFGPIRDERRMRSPMFERCLQRGSDNKIVIAGCDAEIKNPLQDWRFTDGTLHSDIGNGLDKFCVIAPIEDGHPKVGAQVMFASCEGAGEKVAVMRQLYPGIDRK
jgi:polypeptide N-acetylgalactosaminyltransferase